MFSRDHPEHSKVARLEGGQLKMCGLDVRQATSCKLPRAYIAAVEWSRTGQYGDATAHRARPTQLSQYTLYR